MARIDDDFYRLAKERAAAASEAAMLRMLSGKTAPKPEMAPPRTEEERSLAMKLQRKDYRARNRERFLEYERRYRERNGDRLDAYRREYVERNREKIAAYQRERYRKNRETILEASRVARREHRERFLERERKYRERNREKVNARQRELYAIRKETVERRKAELSGREPFFRWALSLSDDDRATLLAVAGRNPRLRRTIIKENLK